MGFGERHREKRCVTLPPGFVDCDDTAAADIMGIAGADREPDGGPTTRCRIRRARILSVIAAAISVIAAAVAMWVIPDSMIDDGSGTVTVDSVEVSRALGVTTSEELAERASQKYTMSVLDDPTKPCDSYNCMLSIKPMGADEAFAAGDTICHPYLQWACAADDYHRAITRTVW